MAVSKETMLTTFKKWPFSNDFDVNTYRGVTSVVCKYCSDRDHDFLRGARYSNIKGSALESIGNFCKEVTYIS